MPVTVEDPGLEGPMINKGAQLAYDSLVPPGQVDTPMGWDQESQHMGLSRSLYVADQTSDSETDMLTS